MSSSLRQGARLANLTSHQLAALSNVPMMPPPPGVRPNFHDPDNNSKPFYVVTSILLFFMTALIANRVYAKTWILRKYTWDDCLLSVLFTMTLYVDCLWGTARGHVWAHRWDLSVAQVASRNFQVPVWFFASFNGIAIGTIRVNFFIAYLNIFGTLRWLRVAAYIGATFTALYHAAISVFVFVFTTPAPGETWFSAITTERYQDFLGTLVPGHVVRFAIDMYILVLPLIAVSQIQLPTRKKLGVCLIFLTGLTACIASALTVYYMHLLVNTPDVTGALMPVCTVILAEMFLGIIVLCIPAAAKTCRHHADTYTKLKSAIVSSSSRFTRRQGSYGSGSSETGMKKGLVVGPVYGGGVDGEGSEKGMGRETVVVVGRGGSGEGEFGDEVGMGMETRGERRGFV